MQPLPVIRHRTARQAWAKSRACRHPVEKTRWHLIWLLLRTDEPRTPARATGADDSERGWDGAGGSVREADGDFLGLGPAADGQGAVALHERGPDLLAEPGHGLDLLAVHGGHDIALPDPRRGERLLDLGFLDPDAAVGRLHRQTDLG